MPSLVGSEMCIRDRAAAAQQQHSSGSTAAAAAAAAAAAVAAARAAAASPPSESRAGCCCVVSPLPSCVCSVSVCEHPGCPSLPWLRGFGLGMKLGACIPIVWTAGARMNLERSSVQIVHSSGKFRAVFFVKSVQFSSFGWIFLVKKIVANTLIQKKNDTSC